MAKEQKYSMIASPQCGWCKKALIMLVENLKDVELFVHDIRSPELWEEVRGYDWKSIPCIWQGGKFIGGYGELVKHLETQKTEEAPAEAPAEDPKPEEPAQNEQ